MPGMPADVWLKNGVTFQSQSGYRAAFDRLRGYGEIVQIIRKAEEDEEDDEGPSSYSYSYSVFFRTKVASSAASREQGLRKCRYNEGVAPKRKPVDAVVQVRQNHNQNCYLGAVRTNDAYLACHTVGKETPKEEEEWSIPALGLLDRCHHYYWSKRQRQSGRLCRVDCCLSAFFHDI